MTDDGWGEWGDGLPIGPGPADPGEWGDGLPLGPPGGAGPTPTPQASDFIFEILVGDTVIWSKQNAFPPTNLELDVSGFTGTQTLTFRIRGLT